jgi:MFS superfamily sulfate permease-like transporter
MLKAKLPWLVVIAIVGIIFGALSRTYMPDIKPRLLSDAYPSLGQAPIASFDYLDRTYIQAGVNVPD